jgi:hypothetical protein
MATRTTKLVVTDTKAAIQDELRLPISFEEMEVEDSESAEEEALNYESDPKEGGSLVCSTETDHADYKSSLLLDSDYCRVLFYTSIDREDVLCACGTLTKDCKCEDHVTIRETQPDLVAEVGCYARKRDNKDQVDGIVTTYQQMTLLSSFETSCAPTTSLSRAFVSCTPTPRTAAAVIPVQRKKRPIFKVDTAPASLAPSATPTKLMIPHAVKAKSKPAKTTDTETDKQLRAALVWNANLHEMLEALLSKQEALDSELGKRKKTIRKTKPKKPHYYAVACGWHVGVFKVPTNLDDYQTATRGFPKVKLRSKKFSTRKAAAHWLQQELADTDAERSESSSDFSYAEEESSVRSNVARSCPSRIRGGGSSPDSSELDNDDEDPQGRKRLRRHRLAKKDIKSRMADKPSKCKNPQQKGRKKPNRFSDILSPETHLQPEVSVEKEDEIVGPSLEIQFQSSQIYLPQRFDTGYARGIEGSCHRCVYAPW